VSRSVVPGTCSDGSLLPEPALISARYRVLRALGSGADAAVYEVLDLVKDQPLALKRLQPMAAGEPRARARAIERFEREFYTLSHLEHPRVVAAYDYAADEAGPYYTMELLGGAALSSLAPVSWQQACRIGAELCSALALLHARRLVLRDLNPRGVRCSADGSAKLLDIASAASMGICKQPARTPGYCAPETLELCALDGRADLYSLGALLYFLLTGRHVYPADTLQQLRRLWGARCETPSQLVRDLPPALDELIMQLLVLDAAVRPASAAQVMEQLAAIEGRPLEEALRVSEACLVTPSLAGRELQLARVRTKQDRAVRGRGSAIVLSGAAGVGRTRMLDACAIEAKLQGALVLRADGSDAAGDYAVIQRLASQLLEIAPELAVEAAGPKLSLLTHAVPALLEHAPEAARLSQPGPPPQRMRLLAALREWFGAISASQPLMFAIDDVGELDEPSAAALALCAYQCRNYAMLIVVTQDSDAAPSAAANAFKLIENTATMLRLPNLSAQHSEALLRSVFGAVPHVQTISQRIHQVAAGNPRDTLQLAQWLIDKRVVRYRAGSWWLPAELAADDLPESVEDGLCARVEALSQRARDLGRALSLSADRQLSFDECRALCPEAAPQAVLASLLELISAQVAENLNDGYAIAQRGFQRALQHGLSATERVRLQLALGGVFERRGDEPFRCALHLLHGAAATRGLDALVPCLALAMSHADDDPEAFARLLRSVPEQWLDAHLRFIALARELDRPAVQEYVLRRGLVGLASVLQVPSAAIRPQLFALLQQLGQLSGLDDLSAGEVRLDPVARLQHALDVAGARHAALPGHARIADPRTAIGHLVSAQIAIANMAALAFDHELWRALPPLAAISAASAPLSVADKLREAVGARLDGRLQLACELYRWLIERLNQPDRAGLETSIQRALLFGSICALGTLEAGMGVASCLSWADALDDEPSCQIAALQIRMLYGYWCGEFREADQRKQRVESLRLETTAHPTPDGTHLISEVTVHAQSEDLARLKHAADEVALFAEQHAGWQYVAEYAAGEYQRVRGDFANALPHLTAAMDGARAGTHQVWAYAAGSRVRTLQSLGRVTEAVSLGRESLAAAERCQLDFVANFIKMPYALALAEARDFEAARRLADDVIAGVRDLGSSGLSLVLAHETRAGVAIHARDVLAYDEHAKLCRKLCQSSGSRALRAKYQRLRQAATLASVQTTLSVQAQPLALLTEAQLTSALAGCETPRQRAERVLSLLARQTGACSGFLFLVAADGPSIAATLGDLAPPHGLDAVVKGCIERELQAPATQTVTTGAAFQTDAMTTSLEWADAYGASHALVVLGHHGDVGFALVGVAALVLESDPLSHPRALATHFSRVLVELGDVVPLLAER
jgi:hypothetical protein